MTPEERALKRWDALSRIARVAAYITLALTALAQIKAHYIYLDETQIVVTGGDSEMRSAAHTILREAAGQSLLDLDLIYWQRRLEDVPKVARAHLRRHAPHALRARLEEHQPLARWEGGGLLDIYGDRYDGKDDLSLPVFKGPIGSARNMIEFYHSAQEILRDSNTAARLAQLELNARGDWRVFLDNGVILYLGHSQPRARLTTYTRHAAALRRRFANVRAVDLRYEHGFSVINDESPPATMEI